MFKNYKKMEKAHSKKVDSFKYMTNLLSYILKSLTNTRTMFYLEIYTLTNELLIKKYVERQLRILVTSFFP